MHGFARLSEWTVESAESRGEQTSITLGLKDTPDTQKLWPHKFAARYTVTISDQLALELAVTNTGSASFSYEEALHTYFAVADIKSTNVEGLAGADYIDKTDAMAVKTQGSKPIRIVEETDRIYLNTTSTCTVHDPGNKRKLIIAKENSDTTVVWNPWIAKAKAMADFGDDEWPKMLCIESCNVNTAALNLDAGATHTLRAIITTQRA
jgi:D-hexose-6-phosphate mutarotase